MVTTRLLYVFIFLNTVCSVFGNYVAVFLGNTVRFADTDSCRVEGAELKHRWSGEATQLVARYRDGLWRPGPGYGDRMKPGVSVTLTSTNFNDNGLYELSCNNTPIQVDVLFFNVLEVIEGRTATLPCYYVTTGAHVEAVWWEKDGQRKFEQNFTAENASLAGYRQGNFSHTLQQVVSQHQGDYLCYVRTHGRKEMGNPAAVRLVVRKPSPGQVPATAPQPSCKSTEDDAKRRTRDIAVTAVVVLVICAASFTLLSWKLKCRWVRSFVRNQESTEKLSPDII